MTTLVLPAAGSGSRFGGDVPKQYQTLAGIPVIARCLLALERSAAVDVIVVAATPEYSGALRAIAAEYGIGKIAGVVAGGAERQHSIWNALQTDAAQSAEIILVHDAARPFITPDFVAALVEAARKYGAAAPGLQPKETVKELTPEGAIARTIDRGRLRLAQTPQAFRREILMEAYEAAERDGFTGTDDASLVERIGVEARHVEGLEENIKITTPFDWSVAELLAARATFSALHTSNLETQRSL